MAAHLLPSVLLPLLLLLALPLTAASLPPAQQQPAGWTTQRNKYPPKYGSHGPKKLPGKFSNSSLGPCFTACTAAHRSHSGCLGFTACSTGPIGCWLYSDVESGVLAPSPDCDWHAAPWVPQALCTRNCSMVTVAGPPGSYYHGTFNGPQGAAKEATTAAACVAACLAQTDCVQSTFSKRPAAPCVLYNSISNALSQTVQTVGSVKCKGGSTDASTCAFFSSGPPPGPPLPPVQPFPLPPPPPPPPPPATVTPHWDDPVASGVTAVPTYLDQVNTVTMERGSKVHDAVFARIKDLQADHIRYLHWDPMPMSYPERLPPKDGKTSWDFTNIDPYVEDFMANTVGHDSVINFAPVGAFLTNKTGYIDPTGVAAGEYFSRIISWYTKGGFVDELGVKHISNHSYDWKYWEVLNEVDAGESGTHCSSLNNSVAAPECARKYTEIYDGAAENQCTFLRVIQYQNRSVYQDRLGTNVGTGETKEPFSAAGIVTVLHRDHPQLQFTGLVTAWPDCAGSEAWFSYFLNASNHRSPVRENFATYVHEVSYHWYSENGAKLPASWRTVGANPGDVFAQSAQFLVSARRIKALVDELAPGTRVYCNEIGVLAPDLAPDRYCYSNHDKCSRTGTQLEPFGQDRWWWNLEAAQYGYVYGELAALGLDGMAASQLTGYPGNAVSISMLDWTNGNGNAWYWVVKMFIDTLGSGKKEILRTDVNGQPANATIRALHPDEWMCIHSPPNSKAVNDAHVAPLYAASFELTAKGKARVVLLVNTKNCSAVVTVAGASGGSVRAVDLSAGFEATPYSDTKLSSDSYTLQGWGVALVTLPPLSAGSESE